MEATPQMDQNGDNGNMPPDASLTGQKPVEVTNTTLGQCPDSQSPIRRVDLFGNSPKTTLGENNQRADDGEMTAAATRAEPEDSNPTNKVPTSRGRDLAGEINATPARRTTPRPPEKSTPRARNLAHLFLSENHQEEFKDGYDSDGYMPPTSVDDGSDYSEPCLETTDGTTGAEVAVEVPEDAVTPTEAPVVSEPTEENNGGDGMHIPIKEEKLQKMTNKELQEELKKCGQAVGGKKSILVD